VPRTKTWKTRHFIKGFRCQGQPMITCSHSHATSCDWMPAHTPKLKTQLSFEFTTTLHVRGSPAHLTSRRPKPILHQFQVLLYIVTYEKSKRYFQKKFEFLFTTAGRKWPAPCNSCDFESSERAVRGMLELKGHVWVSLVMAVQLLVPNYGPRMDSDYRQNKSWIRRVVTKLHRFLIRERRALEGWRRVHVTQNLVVLCQTPDLPCKLTFWLTFSTMHHNQRGVLDGRDLVRVPRERVRAKPCPFQSLRHWRFPAKLLIRVRRCGLAPATNCPPCSISILVSPGYTVFVPPQPELGPELRLGRI
jgi:hypothetical protein